jgi:hypothetical protein
MNDIGQNHHIEGKTCSGGQPRYPGPWSKPGLPGEKSMTNPPCAMTPTSSVSGSIRCVSLTRQSKDRVGFQRHRGEDREKTEICSYGMCKLPFR